MGTEEQKVIEERTVRKGLMSFRKQPGKGFFVVVFVLATLTFHHFAMRPYMLSWGVSPAIQLTAFAGDSLCRVTSHTRGIFIEATPSEIWPWMLQLGQERGGFYSYALLENLFLAKMKNVYELRTELQTPRQRGDTIWLAAKDRYPKIGYQIIALLEPEKSLVLTSGDDYHRLLDGNKASGSWAFYLYPEKNGTWLLVKSSYEENAARYLLYEVPHFIMERKMLLTVRSLVEKQSN